MLLVLATQLGACQKKEDMNTEKLDYDGTVCTPDNYPVMVLSRNVFYSNGGEFITLIPDSDTQGSVWGRSGNGWASDPTPAPDHLSINWYSPTEMKIYEGEFELPQKRIYDLFKEGYMIYGVPNDTKDGKETLHWETYTELLVGIAPKGMVVVWMVGNNKVELGRFQAQEMTKKDANDLYKKVFKSSGDSMPEKVTEKELIAFKVSPEVIALALQGNINCKQWDDYRLRYNWKVVFNQPLEIYGYGISYFNSEISGYPPPNIKQEEYNKIILEPSSKVVPREIDLNVTTQDGKDYLIRLDILDEKETIEAFKNLEIASPKEEISIFININDDFNAFKVVLKNTKKEILLQKATLKLFTIDRKEERNNKKIFESLPKE